MPSREPKFSLYTGQTDDLLELETEDAVDESPINLVSDAYDAVIGATFGAVRITFPSDENGKAQYLRLHPGVIFIFCWSLFTIQLSCLSCLVMDMKISNIWGDATSWDGFDESPERKMKMMIRTVMVLVMQLIGLKELLGALRPITFILNPVAWFEVKRPPRRGFGWLFDAWICVPICVVAKMMQFTIAYYTLTVSMSVIITGMTVKDVIFNGLVVMFLQDLDEYAWVAMAAIFHMDEGYFGDFKVKIKDESVDKDGRRSHARSSQASAEASEVSEYRKYARGTWKIWFYDGKGGKASVLRCIIVFLILTFVYIRQLFIYVQAVHTGILPGARDVCSLYRGLENPAEEWISALQLSVVDMFTLIDYRDMLIHAVNKSGVQRACFTDAYKAGPFDDAMQFIRWWPNRLIPMLISIIAIFALPQLLYANHSKVLSALKARETVNQNHDAIDV